MFMIMNGTVQLFTISENCAQNYIMKNIVNDKRGHNIVNNITNDIVNERRITIL